MEVWLVCSMGWWVDKVAGCHFWEVLVSGFLPCLLISVWGFEE